MGMLDSNRGNKTGQGVSKNIGSIIKPSESCFYDSIIHFFISEVEYHDHYLNFKKRQFYCVFLSKTNHLFVVAIELGVAHRFSIDLKPLGNVDKMRRRKKSYFFFKLLVEYLWDHLTDTSFTITSCYMKNLKRILRWSNIGEKFDDSISARFHASRGQRHDKIDIRMMITRFNRFTKFPRLAKFHRFHTFNRFLNQ